MAEYRMDLRLAMSMMRELLRLTETMRAEHNRAKLQHTDARTLLAELLALAFEQDGHRRLVVEEGSELWQRIAKLALVPREQLELEFPPKKPPARLIERPRRERWGWSTG